MIEDERIKFIIDANAELSEIIDEPLKRKLQEYKDLYGLSDVDVRLWCACDFTYIFAKHGYQMINKDRVQKKDMVE